jgi:aminoglycoside phosphotransferase (APT) family kinase protein
VLDWELAHNGEPLSDLGYILQWFPAGPRPDLPSFGYYGLAGMFSRQEVISTWETVTGRSADGVEVYEVAALVLTVGIIHQGAVKYATGQLADERLKHWGLILGLYLNRARELLERLPGRRPHRHERPLRSRR